MAAETWSISRHPGPDHFILEGKSFTWPEVLAYLDHWAQGTDRPFLRIMLESKN